MGLNHASVRRYHDLGFISPVPGLRDDEAARFRRAFEDYQRYRGDSLRQEHLKYLHLCFPWACELATHATILDAVESLLGPDLLIHSSSVFYKGPADGAFVAWHQDGFSFRLSEPRLVTAWIALTESTVDNGCLKVIPSSHTARVPHGDCRLEGNQLILSIEGGVDEAAAVDITLAPGEFSLHHPDLIHGSGFNGSRDKRIGFAVRYVAPGVSQELVHPPVVVARGRDDHRHFLHIDAPTGATLAECAARQVAIHGEYMRRRNDQLARESGPLR
jgi:ectoine hydroxylase-related dioxygenase (phytanoyl-CoA dioxygenase family)